MVTWRTIRDEIESLIGDFNGDSGWTQTGYDAQVALTKLGATHPSHMDIVLIDDSHHSTAVMVILHREEDDGHASSYCGSDVWIIPQTTGEPPTRFFMSPGSSSELMKAMATIFDIMSASLY